MERKYPNLFSPLFLGKNKVRVRNRIQADPTLIPLLTPEGHPTEGFTAYYRSKAKGGAGIVTIGETAVDWICGRSHDYQINLWGSRSEDALAKVVDAIHQHGALANLELCHGGVFADLPFLEGRKPIGPSAFKRPSDGLITDAMTIDQMRQVAMAYAEDCEILQRCGFDMAIIYCGNGWLLGSFISPFYNKRTDEFGGSIENRMRFPKMVIDAIRERVGNSLLLEMRISASEFDPFYDYKEKTPIYHNAINIDDAIKAIKMVEDDIDIVEAFMGNRSDIHQRYANKPSCFQKGGYYSSLARAIKESGVKIPVMAVGSMEDPQLAEEGIASGHFDMIGIGRALIADPELPNKIRRNQEEEVRPCLRCYHCLDRNTGRYNTDKVLRFSTKCIHRFMCSVNPEIGQQHLYFPPSGVSRKVTIVGGGPAGMQAAITAADRGHKVTIIEKAPKLGGALQFSNNVTFKKVVKDFMDYLVRQVEKRDIEVRLNTMATPESVESEQPDVVIVAIGAKPIVPPIPGIQGKNVMLAIDACYDASRVGHNVVVVGGGQVGCEVALHLHEQGRKVSLVEARSTIAPDAGFTHRVGLIERVEERLATWTETSCVEITPHGVVVQSADGSLSTIEADTVIVAVGYTPLAEEADAYNDTAYDVYTVGDCARVGDINTATRSGYDATLNF